MRQTIQIKTNDGTHTENQETWYTIEKSNTKLSKNDLISAAS